MESKLINLKDLIGGLIISGEIAIGVATLEYLTHIPSALGKVLLSGAELFIEGLKMIKG